MRRATHALAQVADFSARPAACASPTRRRARELRSAARAAVHEAIERYCAAFHDPSRLFWARAGDDPRFLSGPRLPIYSPEQRALAGWPFAAPGGDAEMRWLEGASLVDGGARFVPAAIALVPFQEATAAERIALSTSTGVACGATWADAAARPPRGVRAGRLRDRLAASAVAPRLAAAAGSRLARELDELAGGRGRAALCDLTTDLGAPVVLAVLRARRRGAPSITVGAAAALSRTEAARKAIVEAVSDAARLDEQLRQAPEWTAAPGFGNVRAFEITAACTPIPGGSPSSTS